MAVKKLTMFAAQAMSLSEMFKNVFAEALAGPQKFKVELHAPDGPSTAGGKLALQHITLVPEGGGSSIVIGSANPAEKRAELRTYAHIADAYAQRFKGAKLPVEKDPYDAMVKQMQFFFTDQGLTVVMVDVSRAERGEEAAPEGGGTSPMVFVALGLVVLAVVAVGAFFALK